MIKNLILTSMLAAGAAGMNAADYSVYGNGALNANLVYYGWWNAAISFDAANPAGEGNVIEFRANDGGAAASMGLNLEGDPTTGPLHSATLNFDWYATGTGTYAIRLTSISEQDYSFTVTADDLNKWNSTSLNVAERYPEIANQWNDFRNDGKGYVFGVVLTDGTPTTKIYFNNITYTGIDESWTQPEVIEQPVPTDVPTPTLPEDDVISIFSSAYPAATGFNIGIWGQTTKAEQMQIEGKDVMKITNFNYLGWELINHIDVSEMTHMHVDFWTPDADATFGFTPISPYKEASWIAPEVKTEQWNNYDVELSKFPCDFTDLYQIKFDQGNGLETGYITNVYFYKGETQGGGEEPVEPGATFAGTVSGIDAVEGKEYPYTLEYAITYNEDKTLTITANFIWENGEPVGLVTGSVFVNNENNEFTMIDGVRTATTSKTFEPGSVITVNFYLPRANGVCEKLIQYTVGSKSETPKVPVLTAKAQKVSHDSAEIAYEVTLPEALKDATVTVTCNDAAATASPIVLSGLTPETDYTYTLKATAVLGDETVESEPVVVTFKTLVDGSIPVEGNTVGGTTRILHTADGVTSFIDMNYAVEALADGKLKITYTPSENVSIIGAVAKANVSGTFKDVAGNEGPWTLTFDGPYTSGQELNIEGWIDSATGTRKICNFAYTYGADGITVAEPETFLFAVTGAKQTTEGIEVSYDTYLSEGLAEAAIIVKWTATPIAETNIMTAAEPLSGEATTNPFTIAGVENGVKYTLTFVPTATIGDRQVNGSTVSSNTTFDYTTAIDSIEADASTDAETTYDLQGRRVNNPARGIYIRNGRKIYNP